MRCRQSGPTPAHSQPRTAYVYTPGLGESGNLGGALHAAEAGDGRLLGDRGRVPRPHDQVAAEPAHDDDHQERADQSTEADAHGDAPLRQGIG